MTARQRFFADGWPHRLYLLICFGAAVAIVFAGWWTDAARVDSKVALDFMKLLAFGATLSVLVGLATSPFVVWPFYAAHIEANGGPFAVGDSVQVLSRKYRGHVGTVYATWQGTSVRVELGERRRREFDDVFLPIELKKLA